MVRTQVHLTEEQVKALRKIAITSHLSVAELIRRAVDRMIKASVCVDPDERLKRTLEVVGKFSSYLSGTATNKNSLPAAFLYRAFHSILKHNEQQSRCREPLFYPPPPPPSSASLNIIKLPVNTNLVIAM